MRCLRARLLLRCGRGGGAAVRRGLVLHLHQPHQRRRLHKDGPGPLCADGQHRADTVQPRHRSAARKQGLVRRVCGRQVPGHRGPADMRCLRARLLLRCGRGGGAAVRRGLVLHLHQPHQRRRLHKDGPGPLCADGQHRADTVQPRHRSAARKQGLVRRVCGRQVPGHRGQADMRCLRARLLLRCGRGGGAAVRRGLVLHLHQPHQRRRLHKDGPGPLCADGQHRADTVQPRHRSAARKQGLVRRVCGRQVPGHRGRADMRCLRARLLLRCGRGGGAAVRRGLVLHLHQTSPAPTTAQRRPRATLRRRAAPSRHRAAPAPFSRSKTRARATRVRPASTSQRGPADMRCLRARLLLRCGRGGGAAVRSGLVLHLDQPHQRRRLHKDGPGPLRADGQHRADQVQPRLCSAARRQGLVRRVCGRQVPGR